MRWLWAVPFLAACTAADATSSSVTPTTPPGEDEGDGGDATTPPGTKEDGGSETPPVDAPVRFKIQIDYRFDSAGYFSDPARKKALEGACRIWGKVLSSSFENVPSGTFVLTRNPEQPNVAGSGLTIEYEIDCGAGEPLRAVLPRRPGVAPLTPGSRVTARIRDEAAAILLSGSPRP